MSAVSSGSLPYQSSPQEMLRTCTNNLRIFCDTAKRLHASSDKFNSESWRNLDALLPDVVSSTEAVMNRFGVPEGDWLQLKMALTILNRLPELSPLSGLAVDVRCSLQVTLINVLEPWIATFDSLVVQDDLLTGYQRQLDSSYAEIKEELRFVGNPKNGWVFVDWVRACPEDAAQFYGNLNELAKLLLKISQDPNAEGSFEPDPNKLLPTVTAMLARIDSARGIPRL